MAGPPSNDCYRFSRQPPSRYRCLRVHERGHRIAGKRVRDDAGAPLQHKLTASGTADPDLYTNARREPPSLEACPVLLRHIVQTRVHTDGLNECALGLLGSPKVAHYRVHLALPRGRRSRRKAGVGF